MINQTNIPSAPALAKSVLRPHKTETDTILLELWEIKRELNTQAKFDIAQLANQANAFNLENALRKLNLAVAH